MPEPIYGFADVTNITNAAFEGNRLEGAISIACALSPESISTLCDGVTEQYKKEFIRVSEFLEKLSSEVVGLLEEKGYKARSLPVSRATSTMASDSSKTSFDDIPDRYLGKSRAVAAHAGLGWVGKNGFIVTKHYGPAVVLASIYTNAPLDCAKEVFLSRCGRCAECVKACPAEALSISETVTLANIDEMVDFKACEDQCRLHTFERFGESSDLCGVCIYACPYTKSYLSRKGYPND